MPKYLISFCNSGPAKLAVVGDAGIETVIEIAHGLSTMPVVGVTGLTVHKSQIIAALQSPFGALAILDRTLKFERTITINEARDIHGIASRNDDLLLVSSGANQIISFNPVSGGVKPIWFEGSSLSDTTHLNDITATGDGVFVVQFGPRLPNEMRNGQIVEIQSGKRVSTGLREPHSVTAFDDGLYVLESTSGDLIRFREGFAPQRILGIVGYARGLCITDDYFVVGKSGYRTDSRHRIGDGRLAPFAQSGPVGDSLRASGVFIVDRATLEMRFIDTTAISPEIYQIIALPPDFSVAKPDPTDAASKPAGIADIATSTPTSSGATPVGFAVPSE